MARIREIIKGRGKIIRIRPTVRLGEQVKVTINRRITIIRRTTNLRINLPDRPVTRTIRWRVNRINQTPVKTQTQPTKTETTQVIINKETIIIINTKEILKITIKLEVITRNFAEININKAPITLKTAKTLRITRINSHWDIINRPVEEEEEELLSIHKPLPNLKIIIIIIIVTIQTRRTIHNTEIIRNKATINNIRATGINNIIRGNKNSFFLEESRED